MNDPILHLCISWIIYFYALYIVRNEQYNEWSNCREWGQEGSTLLSMSQQQLIETWRHGIDFLWGLQVHSMRPPTRPPSYTSLKQALLYWDFVRALFLTEIYKVLMSIILPAIIYITLYIERKEKSRAGSLMKGCPLCAYSMAVFSGSVLT